MLEGRPLAALACNLTLPKLHLATFLCSHVQLYMLWFNFILGLNFLFFCFWVWKYNYDNEFETKANKIQTKDKIIEPLHIKYAKLNLTFLLKFERTTNGTPICRFLEKRPWEQVCTKEITLPILIQSSISSLVGGGLGQEGMQTLSSTITT